MTDKIEPRTEEHVSINMSDLRDGQKELPFKTIVETIPHIVWVTGPYGEALYFNKSWYRLTGLSKELSVGNGWLDVMEVSDRAKMNSSFGTTTIKQFEIKCKVRNREGKFRLLCCTCVPIWTEKKLTNWIGVAMDVTEIEESKKYLRSTMNAISAHIEMHKAKTLMGNKK